MLPSCAGPGPSLRVGPAARHSGGVFSGLAPARRRLLIAVLALVTVAVVTLGVLLVVPAVRDEGRPTDQAAPGPVLLVPGYGGSTGSLTGLAAELTAAGRDAAVVPLPGDGRGDLTEASAALGRAVDAAKERTGATTVDVIGYSAGGVVARLWVTSGGAASARRVITLGSPHHGTDLAGAATDLVTSACPLACQQLAPDSDLLRRLNVDETPTGPTWVSIWTDQDEVVTPPDSAVLEGAVNIEVQAVCADAVVDHGGLVSDPLVRAMVLAELAPGDPVPLGPGDCQRLQATG